MTALLSSSSRAPLDNDDVEPLGLSLLELEEEETTDHVIGDLTITLRGYPRSSGQTLQCTGETTWRGGDLLARHLWRRRATTALVFALRRQRCRARRSPPRHVVSPVHCSVWPLLRG